MVLHQVWWRVESHGKLCHFLKRLQLKINVPGCHISRQHVLNPTTVYYISFLNSSVDERLCCCFHFLAIGNNTAVDIGAQVSVLASISLAMCVPLSLVIGNTKYFFQKWSRPGLFCSSQMKQSFSGYKLPVGRFRLTRELCLRVSL